MNLTHTGSKESGYLLPKLKYFTMHDVGFRGINRASNGD